MHIIMMARISIMNILSITTAILLVSGLSSAFVMMPTRLMTGSTSISTSPTSSSTTTTTVLFGTSRKARKMQEEKKEQSRGRSQRFYDAIEEAAGKKTEAETNKEENQSSVASIKEEGKKKKKSRTKEDDKGEDVTVQKNGATESTKADEGSSLRSELNEEAKRRYEERPEVSQMVLDEESGMEVLVQGQKVKDIVTGKAVKLSDLGPEYRLAQMFPGVPPDIRSKYRFDWKTITVPEMIDQLQDACYVKLQDGTRGIPSPPSIANKAIDFVLANRDYLGYRMAKTLGRWTMNKASKGDIESAKEWQRVWRNFLLLENHISAPFRQIIQDAEGRCGPNFGNLDLKSFCRGELYERIGNYVVFKGMQAHWEKKVLDADFYEKTPEDFETNFMEILGTGDPKRYLPDSPILFTLQECAQVCGMAQQMVRMFVDDEVLFGDFPPEIVFFEEAMKIKGGTALRKYMIEEFCPSRDITPEGLREGIRRFYQQLENMQIDPYGDLTNKVEQLYKAMAVGTDDERDPYEQYLGIESLDPNSPTFIDTYTFNYSPSSLVQFLDSQYPGEGGFIKMVGKRPANAEPPSSSTNNDNPFDFGNILEGLGLPSDDQALRFEPDFNYDETADDDYYDTPPVRAAGRPHNLGWLQKLNDIKGEKSYRLGDMPPGRIIPDNEA